MIYYPVEFSTPPPSTSTDKEETGIEIRNYKTPEKIEGKEIVSHGRNWIVNSEALIVRPLNDILPLHNWYIKVNVGTSHGITNYKCFIIKGLLQS